jgi:hypothetical protein
MPLARATTGLRALDPAPAARGRQGERGGQLRRRKRLRPQAAPDNDDNRSPETYIGYGRAEHFISGGVTKDAARVYSVGVPQLNQWGLTGDWTVGEERAVLNRKDGGIIYRFHARDLHLVLGSPSGNPVRFKVTIDGKPPGDRSLS